MRFVYTAYGDEHIEMAHRSANTVLKHHPDAGISVITPDVNPYAFTKPFMLTNIMCQTDFLAEVGDDFVVFLDSDIIMMQPLLDRPAADMWVTWRDNVGEVSKTMPYNYGVLMVRGTIDILRAFMWMERRVAMLAPEHQKWYGNQIALRELVGPLSRDQVVHREFDRFAIDVCQLPCRKWNWSPPDDRPKQSASDKVFVHLKGDRKDLFDYYYDKVMA